MPIGPLTIAASLRTALHAGDPPATQHPAPPRGPLGRDRNRRPRPLDRAQVLRWHEERNGRGVLALAEETFAYPGAVVLGLRITDPDAARDQPDLRYRVFHLAEGRVHRIRDYTERSRALTAACRTAPDEGDH